LGTVMAALDSDSYRCTQPLHVPRHALEPVFEQSLFPVVCVHDNDLILASEKAKTDKEHQCDVTFGDSTRDESRISAYGTPGILKLLENTGCDTSQWDSIIQPKLQHSLSLDLMLHQQHAICWMVQMESLPGFGINSILWEEREFFDGGKYYYAPALGQLRLRKPPTVSGGLLCDEMGLGKTIDIIGLILATLDELKEEASQSVGIETTHATLIVVPPALVDQWQNEIVKCAGTTLAVDVLEVKRGKVAMRRNSALQEPDVVLTSYNVLQRPAAACTLFKSWGRIVLDEMQEIRSSSTKIARICEKIESHRRWMLSGTPLFEGIEDLCGELNFIRLEPFAAKNEDGFFSFSVSNPWEHHHVHAIETLRVLGQVMLRRSKNMTIRGSGLPILGLKPLTIEFVPVPQTLSERALYYFLEYIVARELRVEATVPVRRFSAKQRSSRTLYISLLRDMCNSAVR
jgi:SNF2-related domain